MDFVTIATPNASHYPIAKAALEAGFAVVCDKPMTVSTPEALALADLATKRDLPFAVTYNYTGYPMVMEATYLVASGRLGAVRRADVEYLQGWLATREEDGNKQAAWRTDPAVAGPAGSLGDIGSHAHNLVESVTGLAVTEVCAELNTFVSGRRLDDDANVLLRLQHGARGRLSVSQIAAGEENALCLRVYCERGGLTWRQQDPNTLRVSWIDRPAEIRRTGGPGLAEQTSAATRLPSGHPEGYLEAFANLYRAFVAHLDGGPVGYPTATDGLQGMRFLTATVASHNAGGRWTALRDDDHSQGVST